MYYSYSNKKLKVKVLENALIAITSFTTFSSCSDFLLFKALGLLVSELKKAGQLLPPCGQAKQHAATEGRFRFILFLAGGTGFFSIEPVNWKVSPFQNGLLDLTLP